MHTIRTARPHPPLREFVRCYAQREIACSPEGLNLPFIASLESILSFNFDDRETMQRSSSKSEVVSKLHILGPQSFSARQGKFSGHVRAFGIFLRPTAFWRLFRVPASVVTDHDFDGSAVLGPHMDVLWSRLAEASSFEHQIFETEKHLLPFARNALSPNGVMLSASWIARGRGPTGIQDLADLTGLSCRQYERRFAELFAMSPKRFSRIARFQKALDAKRITPSSSWLTIAHESGYYDQAHLIKDFESLGGEPPRLVVKQSGDLQPWSLAKKSPRVLT